MTTTAVIPVKRLRHVKQRLSSRLSSRTRAALVLQLLARELDILLTMPTIDQTIVVTSDEQVRELAEMKHALVALQPDSGVNAAIGAGIELAYGAGAETVLAIHADLPFVGSADIEALQAASAPGVVVIAPDRKRSGTNAVVLNRSAPLELQFGAGSFARHLAAARSANLAVREIVRCGLGLDLDTPGDLVEYRRHQRRIRAGTQSTGSVEARTPGKLHTP